MEQLSMIDKARSFASPAAGKVMQMGQWVWKALTFSLADKRVMPGQCVAVYLGSGGIAVAYGVRHLSRVKIKATRRYPAEEGKYPPPEVFASTVHLAINDLQSRQADVILVVPKAWAIVKTADFPLVVKENLSNVVGYELDRLTPFLPEKAYYDYQVLGEEGGRLQIILAALRADTLDPYLHALRQKGIQVKQAIVSLSALGALCHTVGRGETVAFLDVRADGYEGGVMEGGYLRAPFAGSFPSDVGPEKTSLVAAAINPLVEAWNKEGKALPVFVTARAGSLPDLAASIRAPVRNLGEQDGKAPFLRREKTISYAALGGVLEYLRPEARALNLLSKGIHEYARQPWAITILLLVALGVLGLFSLAASVQTATKRVEAVEREIAARNGEVRQVETLQKEVETLEKELKALYGFKTDKPMVMELFRELTQVLPANSWLARVRLNDTAMHIEGYAAAATDMLPKLEASPYFKKVEFASPTYRDVRMKADRFAIRMEMASLQEVRRENEKKQ